MLKAGRSICFAVLTLTMVWAQGYQAGQRLGKTPQQVVNMGRVGWLTYVQGKGLLQAHVDEGNADATYTECENVVIARLSRPLAKATVTKLNHLLTTLRAYNVESGNIAWQEAGGGNAFDPDDGDSMGVADLRYQVVRCLAGKSPMPKGAPAQLEKQVAQKLKAEDLKIETYRKGDAILEGVSEGLNRGAVVDGLHQRNRKERKLLVTLLRQLDGLPQGVGVILFTKILRS